jgi:hypothetical protein
MGSELADLEIAQACDLEVEAFRSGGAAPILTRGMTVQFDGRLVRRATELPLLPGTVCQVATIEKPILARIRAFQREGH